MSICPFLQKDAPNVAVESILIDESEYSDHVYIDDSLHSSNRFVRCKKEGEIGVKLFHLLSTL